MPSKRSAPEDLLHLGHASWCDRTHIRDAGSVFRGCRCQVGEFRLERSRPGTEPRIVVGDDSFAIEHASPVASLFEETAATFPGLSSGDAAGLLRLAADLRLAARVAGPQR